MDSILRVEHKDSKLGPYRGSYNMEKTRSVTDIHCFRSSSYDYPAPCDDIGIERKPHDYEFCGFKDIHQLKKWFNSKELATMEEDGFVVKRLSLEDVEVTDIGERQLLFCYRPK